MPETENELFALNFIRIITVLTGIVGASFIVPVSFGIFYGETRSVVSFLVPMAVSLIALAAVNVPLRRQKITLNIRQTFAVVAGAWVFTSVFGALPLWLSGAFPSFTDALFESVSGFTTTGATVSGNVEILPVSVNVWRCQTHWLGGMGIVTLTVALLPLLGVGGFQLIKAETTGPEKGKVTARIATTAKILWIIYSVMTAVQTVLLMLAGMNFSDALAHSFATLGTGGFSTRNASIGSYNSTAADVICAVFMFLSGINFSLFYYIIVRKFSEVRMNSELKAYAGIIAASSVAAAACLVKFYGGFLNALRFSFFQVVTIITTTGFSTADYTAWPSSAQFWIFLMFFIGGCSGSTAGGIKVVRWVVLFKQIGCETKRMLHPHGIFSIRLNGRPGSKDTVFTVAAFMVVYFVLVMITSFAGCAAGLDMFTAFTASLSMVGNVGPAFGDLGPAFNWGFLPSALKWWYCFAMLAGRLELYTMIIFFLPSYWRK